MAVINSVAFWVPGTVRIPGDDGKPIEIKFRARFKRLKKSERLALEHCIEANKLSKEVREGLRARLDDANDHATPQMREYMEAVMAATPITDAEFVRATLVDLDMKGADGTPVIYSPLVVAEIEEELDGFEAELVRIYIKARKQANTPQDAEKNSETQSGTTSS